MTNKIFNKISLVFKMIRMNRQLRPLIKNQIFFQENRDQTVWGSISDKDEKVIIDLVKRANAIQGPIIEIGALFGLHQD